MGSTHVAWLPLLCAAGAACASVACGGGPTVTSDAVGTDGDASDGWGESAPDADTAGDHADTAPDRGDWTSPDYGGPPPDSCGDGIVDPGEECDDGNRMNGDGCDWSCHVGDGEFPSATPDPAAGRLDPDAATSNVDLGAPSSGGAFVEGPRIPLQWSGSEYALVWPHTDPLDPASRRHLATFVRFDRTGVRIEGWWSYEYGFTWTAFDLAWGGSRFGLGIENELDDTVYFVVLDANGKPASDPVPIGTTPAPNPLMQVVSDDLGYSCTWPGITFARLDPSGRHRDSGCAVLDELATASSGLAWSGTSYLLTWLGLGGADRSVVRYAVLRSDLTLIVGPRTLGPNHSLPPMAVAEGDELAVAWLAPGPDSEGTGGPVRVHVARFDRDGRLLGPPTPEPDSYGLLSWPSGAAAASGADSVAVVVLAPNPGTGTTHLRLLRFDLFGTFIEQVELSDTSTATPLRLTGGLGIACDGLGFGVVARPMSLPADYAPVFFRWAFRP